MDNKTVVIGALVIGAIVVVLVLRGGSSGGGVQTLGSMPTSDATGAKSAAFSSLLDLGREQIDANRDLSLAKIQGTVEDNRIASAERASLAESESQVRLANIQASTQQNSSFLDFLGSAVTAVIAAA